jgi:cyclic pyranopterin phosphate synthase
VFQKLDLLVVSQQVRKDFFEIIKIIKKNSGIKKTVITTNGYKLNKIAKNIKDSGLDGINISIDSLNSKTFKKLLVTTDFLKF